MNATVLLGLSPWCTVHAPAAKLQAWAEIFAQEAEQRAVPEQRRELRLQAA